MQEKQAIDKPKDRRGGVRVGAGRKLMHEGGRKQLAVSCSAAQKAAIQRAAALAGLTPSQYVLQKCGV